MAETPNPKTPENGPSPRKPSIEIEASSNIDSFSGHRARFPNPPDPMNPDAATLREQWRFAIRQYSKWYSHAWGTAILAGGAFFALGWIIKGGNPLPSKDSDRHKNEGLDTSQTHWCWWWRIPFCGDAETIKGRDLLEDISLRLTFIKEGNSISLCCTLPCGQIHENVVEMLSGVSSNPPCFLSFKAPPPPGQQEKEIRKRKTGMATLEIIHCASMLWLVSLLCYMLTLFWAFLVCIS